MFGSHDRSIRSHVKALCWARYSKYSGMAKRARIMFHCMYIKYM